MKRIGACGRMLLRRRRRDRPWVAIAEIDKEVEVNLDPFRPFIPILISIPGIAELSARVVLAEIGTDMGRFATARHLISRAGLCPKNDERAGKRRSTRMRKGAPWLKPTLIQCACAATHRKGSYLQAIPFVSELGAEQRKQSARSPNPSLPPPSTCSRPVHSTKTSGLIASSVDPSPARSSVLGAKTLEFRL